MWWRIRYVVEDGRGGEIEVFGATVRAEDRRAARGKAERVLAETFEELPGDLVPKILVERPDELDVRDLIRMVREDA
jgi:hypothetical protein